MRTDSAHNSATFSPALLPSCGRSPHLDLEHEVRAQVRHVMDLREKAHHRGCPGVGDLEHLRTLYALQNLSQRGTTFKI